MANRIKDPDEKKTPKTFSLKTGSVDRFFKICEVLGLDTNVEIQAFVDDFNKRKLSTKTA